MATTRTTCPELYTNARHGGVRRGAGERQLSAAHALHQPARPGHGRVFIVNNAENSFAYLPDALSRLIDGVLPSDTYTHDQPFTQVNGSIAHCSQAAFMAAYSTTYVPVYACGPCAPWPARSST